MTLRLSIAQIFAGGYHRVSKPILSKVALRTGLEPTPASPLTERIVWAFVAIGCLLRLRQFLFDRALWNDESMLALNLIHRSPAELLKPLEYDQGAPVGFLLLGKMALLSFGSSEMALRFLPFVCGIASLFLFKAVSSRFLSATGVPIAVGLFAIASPLIYYSTEVKQYSSDVAIALMLYPLADSQLEMPLRLNRVVVFSMIGAIAMWLSHPAVFIVAGWGLSLLWVSFRNHDRRSLILLSVPGVFWCCSFLTIYLLSLGSLTSNSYLLTYWQGIKAFPPVSQSFGAYSLWLVDSLFGLFSDAIGLKFAGIAGVAAVMGACTFSSKQKARVILLTAPIALTLFASILHRYPFYGRLLLFLVPSAILLIVGGLGMIRIKTRETLPLLGLLLIVVLSFHPVVNAARYFRSPVTMEEIRPIMEYVVNHSLKGDNCYVYWGARPSFEYYAARQSFQTMNIIFGRETSNDRKPYTDNWRPYREDLDSLRGKGRVWILFSHNVYNNQEQQYLDYLDGIGQMLDSAKADGASVYLFDLGVAQSRTDVPETFDDGRASEGYIVSPTRELAR